MKAITKYEITEEELFVFIEQLIKNKTGDSVVVIRLDFMHSIKNGKTIEVSTEKRQ